VSSQASDAHPRLAAEVRDDVVEIVEKRLSGPMISRKARVLEDRKAVYGRLRGGSETGR